MRCHGVVARGLPGFGYLGALRRNRVDAVPIRFAGSYQRDDTGERWPSKWSCVDVRKKSTPARATGRRHRVENLRGLHLFPADVDGKELVEIDTINMIEKVNGSTGWSNTAAISACDFHPVSLLTG